MQQCSICGASIIDNNSYCLKCRSNLDVKTGMMPSQTIIGDRYLIIERVGQGGMGAVYKALDTRLDNATVAIKEMSSKALPDGDIDQTVESFKREAAILTTLRHSALPRVTDFFSDGEDRWYLVMDFIEGETLQSVFDRRGRIPEAEVLNWAYQIAAVLDYLHHLNTPVIIRDLKPANIMLTASNEIKLIDFGIARHFMGEKRPDSTFMGYGSQGFAPPEQYGESQTDVRSDLYSLGATLHYLLSGIDPKINPFQFADLKSMGVSASLNDAIQKAVEIDAGKRPADIREMLALFPSQVISIDETMGTELLNSPQYDWQDRTRILKTGLDRGEVKERVAAIKKTARIVSILLLILVIVSGGSIYAINRYRGDYYLKQAISYLEKGNYEEARKISNRAINCNPRLGNAYAVRAAAYAELGDNRKALKDCSEAIRLKPYLAMPYYVQGKIFNSQEKYKKGKDQCMKALKIDPKVAVAYIYLAQACNGLKNYDEAIENLKKAESLNSHSALLYVIRGQTYNYLFRPEQARNEAKRAIKLSPQLLSAHLCLAEANLMLYEYNDALDNANQAVWLKPNSPLAHVLKAEALGSLFQTDTALAECQKAIQIDPNFARAYSAQGFIYRNKQYLRSKTITEFQKAISLGDGQPQYHVYLADEYLGVKYTVPNAIVEANTAIKLDSHCLSAYVVRGEAYKLLNMQDKALDDFNYVIEQAPAYIPAYIMRAGLYRDQDEYEKSLRDYESVQNINDKIATVYGHQGLCYSMMKDYQKALEMCNRAIELDPQDYSGYEMRACVYEMQGLKKQAGYDSKLADTLRKKRFE